MTLRVSKHSNQPCSVIFVNFYNFLNNDVIMLSLVSTWNCKLGHDWRRVCSRRRRRRDKTVSSRRRRRCVFGISYRQHKASNAVQRIVEWEWCSVWGIDKLKTNPTLQHSVQRVSLSAVPHEPKRSTNFSFLVFLFHFYSYFHLKFWLFSLGNWNW